MRIFDKQRAMLLGTAAACVLSTACAAAAGTHFAVIGRIPGPSGGWDYSTVDTSTNQLYLARDAGVLSMDLANHTIKPVAVAGEGVHQAEPAGDTGLVVQTNGDKDTVSIFDAKTFHVRSTVAVGKRPDAAIYDPSTKLVAVINHAGGTVSLVDAAASKVVRTINVGGDLEYAAPSGDGRMFLNVADTHAIAVLDLNAGTVLRRFVLNGCEDPSGLAYDAADSLVASVCGNGVTKIIRAADGEEVATLHTGLGSDGLIYNERSRMLFVPSAASAKLSVVALGPKPEIVQEISTGPGVRSGTIDPATGTIYLPSAKLGPPKAPSPWPTVVPGTFAILVVGQAKG